MPGASTPRDVRLKWCPHAVAEGCQLEQNVELTRELENVTLTPLIQDWLRPASRKYAHGSL